MTHPTGIDPPRSAHRISVAPSTLGTIYCVVAALCYTLMGICLRELSENCDPVWVNCVQASVSTLVFGVYLVVTSIRGRSAWPPAAVAAALVMLGTVTQLGGASYLWSLSVIGLSVGNPLQMGIMLAASALLGLVVLGERISWRSVSAIVLITVSVFLVSSGAGATSEVDQAAGTAVDTSTGATAAAAAPATMPVLLAVAAASFAGVAFAILTVGVRKTVTEDTAPEAIVFFINAMGIAFLGPWAVARLGIDGLAATSARDFGVMLATGGFNLLGFLLLTRGLRLTTVVRVNIITNALTTSLTVLAGIVLFAERPNRQLLLGIFLILVGVVLISYREPAADEAGEPAA